MRRGLIVAEKAGTSTAPPCCRLPIEHESVQQSGFTVHVVNEEFDPDALKLDDPERDEREALAATLYYRRAQEGAPTITSGDGQA